MMGNRPRGYGGAHERRKAGVVFFAGLAVVLAGIVAFAYAHDHDPTPGADPEAVRLISRGAYERLHYGGIAAIAAGTLLMLAALAAVLAKPDPAGG
jgi:hypothetical protein